jgi:hypothetical protein
VTRPVDALASEEFRLLQVKFSSGVTLKELRSLAAIIVSFRPVAPPGGNAERHFPDMVKWFVDNWAQVSPWMPFIALLTRFWAPLQPLAILSKLSRIGSRHFTVQQCGRRCRSMPAMRVATVGTAVESCTDSSMASGQTADPVEQADRGE